MLILNIGFGKSISDNVDVIDEDHCDKRYGGYEND